MSGTINSLNRSWLLLTKVDLEKTMTEYSPMSSETFPGRNKNSGTLVCNTLLRVKNSERCGFPYYVLPSF